MNQPSSSSHLTRTMRLTSFTDYSLRVLMFLAAWPERRATISEIAKSFTVSENHLTKVVHFLGKQGWVETLRGKGGGLRLAKQATDISIGEVVRDTEGSAVPAECFDEAGGPCAIVSVCRLKGVLSEAVQTFFAVLDRYTVADLTHHREELGRVLRIQPA